MSSSEAAIIDTNALSFQPFRQGAQLTPEGPEIATDLLAGCFTKQSGDRYLWSTPDLNVFMSKYDELKSDKDKRLISFDTWQKDATTTVYTGCWAEKPGATDFQRTRDWAEFKRFVNNRASSMRLLDIDIHATGNFQWFTGVWGGTPIKQTLVVDKPQVEFMSEVTTLLGQGYRLIKVQVIPAAETYHFTGLLEKGEGANNIYMYGDWDTFLNKYLELEKTMQLTDFQVYDDNGTRFYVGVWRETTLEHKFIYQKDWGTFVNEWDSLSNQGYRLQKCVRYRNTIAIPDPQWDAFFKAKLAPLTEGYAYCVAQNGTLIASGGVGKARKSQDKPETAWTIDTRMHLASVSKPITAVAILRLCSDRSISIDSPFLTFMINQFPNAGPGVDQITIRNLLTMQSGMTATLADQALAPTDTWAWLKAYLAKQNVPAGVPGTQPPVYNNANYFLLQALISCMTGFAGQTPDNYVNYVSQTVLKPMGIDVSVFNTTPDPQNTSVLTYDGANDTRPGQWWGPFTNIGAGGWISSARELIKFVSGVRNHVVLSPYWTQQMFDAHLGWYTWDGVFGQYFQHNGGLSNGATPKAGLGTGIFHFADGYDVCLMINGWGPDPIQMMVDAFQQRIK